jgi:hypothetical protein
MKKSGASQDRSKSYEHSGLNIPWATVGTAVGVLANIAAFIQQFPLFAIIAIIILGIFYAILIVRDKKTGNQNLLLLGLILAILIPVIWLFWPLSLTVTVFIDTNQNAIMDSFEPPGNGGIPVTAIDSTGTSRQIYTNSNGIAIFRNFPRGSFTLEVGRQKVGGQAHPYTVEVFVGIPGNLPLPQPTLEAPNSNISPTPSICPTNKPPLPPQDPEMKIRTVTLRVGKQDITIDKTTSGIRIDSQNPTLSILGVTYESPTSSTDTVSVEAFVRKDRTISEDVDNCDGRFASGGNINSGEGSIDLDGYPFTYQGREEWLVEEKWDMLCIILVHNIGTGYQNDDRLCIPIVWVASSTSTP